MGQLTKQEKRAHEKACKNCLKQYRAAAKHYQTYRNIFKRLLGYCPCCETYFKYGVKTERRHTQYWDEASNWLTACKDCHEEDDVYFDDLWGQYYSSIW